MEIINYFLTNNLATVPTIEGIERLQFWRNGCVRQWEVKNTECGELDTLNFWAQNIWPVQRKNDQIVCPIAKYGIIVVRAIALQPSFNSILHILLVVPVAGID
jgi:hypothetical protein